MLWLDYGRFGVFHIYRVTYKGRNAIVQQEPCPSRHIFILCIFIIFQEYKAIVIDNVKPKYAVRATVVQKRRKKIEWLSMIVIAHRAAVALLHGTLFSLWVLESDVITLTIKKWLPYFFFLEDRVSFYVPLLVNWQWHLPDGRKCKINIRMKNIQNSTR